MSDFIEDIAVREIINKMVTNGHGDIVDAFLLNDNKCYTKKGRLNKSGACRVLNVKPKQLEDRFAAIKKLLESDIQYS